MQGMLSAFLCEIPDDVSEHLTLTLIQKECTAKIFYWVQAIAV